MAAASVSFDLREIDEVRKMLARAALDTNDRQRLLGKIGEQAVSQTQERFSTKKDPEGNTWKALADKTKARYSRMGKDTESILNFEGYLQLTVINNVEDGGWSVLVGSVMEYAAVHQFGFEEKGIPKRPYLGISTDNAKNITALVSEFLNRRLK